MRSSAVPRHGEYEGVSGILEWVAGAITGVISATGYLGIAALMALESACVPLPSEIIMPFAGYLASTGRFSLFWAATAGAVGCNLGSTAVYLAVATVGRRLVERWGRYLLIGPEELAWSERFFERHGSPAVLVGRLLPVVRTFVAVPAGLARMSQWRFQVYTFVGSWPWCFGLAWIGSALGERWNDDPTLKQAFHRFDLAIALALACAVGLFAWRRLRARAR